jgi:DNA polymerase III sliding clamp (beta) subunit (PCNA family)
MLDALKFVQGAVDKKAFLPSLTHFCIRDRTVLGFNGQLALCSPIDIDLDVAPNAFPFVKAISACEETIALHVSSNGKLVVRSGAFKSNVDCIETKDYPAIKPDGVYLHFPDKSLLPALRQLEPFVAEDERRPWACGVLFDGQSAFATNNIVLVQYWLGYQCPFQVNIPLAAMRELLRIGVDPVAMQMTARHMTFHYSDKRWLRTQLLELNWPNLTNVLKHDSARAKAFSTGLFEGLETIKPFADSLGKVYFQGDKLATTPNSDAAGTAIKLAVPAAGCYNVNQLLNLKEIADKIDFEAFPQPAFFYGKHCRGLIVGFRE